MMSQEQIKNELKELVAQPEKLMPLSAALIDPDEQVKWGHKAARALVAVISTKKKPVMMNGEQYLEFEDWQVLARFYNYTVGTEWTKEINRDGKLFGFESKAVVRNAAGVVVSSAEASCLRDEPKWNTRTKYGWQSGARVKVGEEMVPEFQLKSMAQTRACAKALRNVLAWVVTLAGYRPTPAEEIDSLVGAGAGNGKQAIAGEYAEYGVPAEPFPSKPAGRAAVKQTSAGNAPQTSIAYNCSDCHAVISKAEAEFSQRMYKMQLCRNCQGRYKKR